MGVTPGKKSPKKTPKHKSPAVSEPMETAAISPKKKIAITPTEKAMTQKSTTPKSITPNSSSNGSQKKSDSKQKKSLKRKLDDVDYEDVRNSEAVVSEEDLNDSQKESSKKQKKKKQRVESGEESLSLDGAKKSGLSSGDEEEDEAGSNIPSKCKLFVTSLGLDGMSKLELKTYFTSHGYSQIHVYKQLKSRHAFVGFATEKEAKKARESLDKTDCRGFPLSIDSRDLLLSSLRLIKPPNSATLINKEGTADCMLYVSPITPSVTKQQLMNSFIGVVRVIRKSSTRNWVRIVCINSTVAKELHMSHQGKVVDGCALKLETAEEFRNRITEEEQKRARQLQKQRNLEKKMEKKQKQAKKPEKKSKPKPKASSDEENDESDSDKEVVGGGGSDDEDDVRVVNDDSDSEEEAVPPKSKKAKKR